MKKKKKKKKKPDTAFPVEGNESSPVQLHSQQLSSLTAFDGSGYQEKIWQGFSQKPEKSEPRPWEEG